MDRVNEERLVALAQEGDDEALIRIIENYKVLVRAKARVYFIAGGDREDIIQEGMIGLFKAIKDYAHDKDSSFRSFAEMCIIRQIITAVKAATRQKHQPLNSYISFSKPMNEGDDDRTYGDVLVINDNDNPEQLLILQEEMCRLEEDIRKRLSDMETTVFNMYLAGLSYIEIADKMQKSPKAIDNALGRIKKKAELV
jgi:RNA polymerase sporulation-specific sigma factor